MANKNSSSDDRDQRLDEVLAAYLDAVEDGQKVDREEWLRRYPDLAEELSEFFANHDQMAPLAGTAPSTASLDSRGSVTVVTQNLGPQDGAGLAKDSPFASYKVLEEIGRGGMGIIYRARQVGLNRIVALKLISAGAFAGADSIRRFRIEAGAAAALDHPNIVPVYEIGEHQGNHFFSMKFIEGGSLAQWLAARPVSTAHFSVPLQRDIARMLATIAHAVHHAHQRGVLHRDLKPANILLQRDGSHADEDGLRSATPLVTDFGLAKRARSDGSVSQSLTIVGTASYMPPEQAVPNGAPLTVAADVYSLGAVLYEMLTGRPPFRGESLMGTLIQVVGQPPCRHGRSIPRSMPTWGAFALNASTKHPAIAMPALVLWRGSWKTGRPVNP